MGTERALGRGGSYVVAERTRLAETAPRSQDESVHGATAHETQDEHKSKARAASPIPQREMGAMGGMKMGGSNVPPFRKLLVTLITVAMLACGIWLAGHYGDFSMRAGEMDHQNQTLDMQMNEMEH